MNSGEVIGQAKRYKNIETLRPTLKKEVEKVESIAPKRYIFVVSFPLNNKHRKEIHNLFYPYIQVEADIIDETDLNKLLDENEAILFRHNKLWLSSTKILKKVIESTIKEATSDKNKILYVKELNEISAIQDYFVSTKLFPLGVDILKKQRILIITGEPGIGKTTLGRAIAHHCIEYEQFHEFHTHSSISPLQEMVVPTKKSVFFVDDFLGATIYNRPYINNISSFEQFIEWVQHHGHVLIITKREYIYQQERLVNPRLMQLDDYKFVIRHSGYTLKDKVQMLTNHVKNADLCYSDLRNLKHHAEAIVSQMNFRPKLLTKFIREDGANANQSCKKC